MEWLKSVTIDILVTILIAVFVLTNAVWAKWVILIYTPLMLLLKLLVLGAGSLVQFQKKGTPEAPSLFYHFLYGVNVLLLLIERWWLMVALWAAIWILSIIAKRRESTPVKVKPGRSR